MLTLYDVPLIMSSQPELCGHLLVPRGWPHINAGGAMTRGGGGGGEGGIRVDGIAVLSFFSNGI